MILTTENLILIGFIILGVIILNLLIGKSRKDQTEVKKRQEKIKRRNQFDLDD